MWQLVSRVKFVDYIILPIVQTGRPATSGSSPSSKNVYVVEGYKQGT